MASKNLHFEKELQCDEIEAEGMSEALLNSSNEGTREAADLLADLSISMNKSQNNRRDIMRMKLYQNQCRHQDMSSVLFTHE